MKTIFTTIICICFISLLVKAQDTLYIYHSGAVVAKQAVAEIDSIIFYIPNTVIDIDGNVYKTVTIGTQVWMAENLRTSKYNDGNPVQEVKDGTEWAALSAGAFCWYNNDSASNNIPYGKFYNWYAVETGKLCPAGWHVATNGDWNTLITVLGGASVAGGKLKEAGTAHWNQDAGSTNSSGFTALPNLRDDTGLFHPEPGKHGLIWTGTFSDENNAYQIRMDAYDNETQNDPAPKKGGYYVRCIKD